MGATSISKLKKIKPEQLGLESTIMALREEIMEYFTGDIGQRFTRSHNISFVNMREYMPLPRQSYLRRKMLEERRTLVMLGGVPILTLMRKPDTIVFHVPVLQRSKQFQEIERHLNKFIKRFLPAVRKEESHANIIYK